MSKKPSYKKHGVWVRLKGTTREGRISYYDHKTGLVWVMWEAENYIRKGHKYKVKTYSASGHWPGELREIRKYEPTPWIKTKRALKALAKREMRS